MSENQTPSNNAMPREQEGWARSLNVPEGAPLTCSSFFVAYNFWLNDFRGSVTPSNATVPAHKECTIIAWETSPAEAAATTTFTWIGGSQVRPVSPAYPQFAATLFIDGVEQLRFPLGRPEGWSSKAGDVTLSFEPRRFQSLVEIPHRVHTPEGASGLYRLEVPARLLQAGKPLRLRVELAPTPEGIETFFYVSPRADALKVDLAILREEVTRLQQDMVTFKLSHEQLYAQIYPELFPQRIQGTRKIVHQEQTKHLHPATVTVMRDGEIVVTCREATDHLAIDGRIVAFRSNDNGQTWNGKEVLYDLGHCDHRAAPIFELPNGDWLTTDYRAGGEYSVEDIWDIKAAKHGPTLWGAWSTDKGKTWNFSDEPMTVPGAHFPYAEVERHMIQLPSGRLLVPANYIETGPNGAEPTWQVYRIALFCSDDDGRSWRVLSHLPRHPHTIGEATLLQTKGGKIILLSRTSHSGDDAMAKGGLLQSDSDDDGQSWSEWRQTGMSSMDSPGHLIQLQDGRILCTHASRSYPGSVYVTLSSDEGTTWDTANTRIVTNDIANWDSCYPTSGQMADGTIITVWYANLFGKFFIPALLYRAEGL
jgi:hypothetical protein